MCFFLFFLDDIDGTWVLGSDISRYLTHNTCSLVNCACIFHSIEDYYVMLDYAKHTLMYNPYSGQSLAALALGFHSAHIFHRSWHLAPNVAKHE
jgi:hypothetical protein